MTNCYEGMIGETYKPADLTTEANLSPPGWIQGEWIDTLAGQVKWCFQEKNIYLRDDHDRYLNFVEYIPNGYGGHYRHVCLEEQENNQRYVLNKTLYWSFNYVGGTSQYYYIFNKLSPGEICYRSLKSNYYDGDSLCVPDSLGAVLLVKK